MYPYIRVFGRVIGTYGLCMTIGIALACILAFQKGRKQGTKLEDILIIGAFALLGGLPSGAILYAFVTFSPAQIWNSVLTGDFSVFGGLVFYGALIGGILGGLIGMSVVKCSFDLVEDSIVPFIPLGHGIGRIGCVMAGCCNGMPYDGPFAIYYPNSVAGLPSDQGYFPVQLVEAVANLCICGVLLWITRKGRKPGVLLSIYLCLYALTRFLLEFLRGDSIRGKYGLFSTSQWIAVLMVVCSITYILGNRRKNV